jgi:DNA-binding SARP family transcriptional activator
MRDGSNGSDWLPESDRLSSRVRQRADRRVGAHVLAEGLQSAVGVCLLGNFRVLKRGAPISLRPGGKGEQLLGHLALRSPDGMLREALIAHLWPEAELGLATQSLNTLVYSLHRLLGDALDGRPPIVSVSGQYRLNADAGVEVDIAAFDNAVRNGDRLSGIGDRTGAVASYRGAVALYSGDLAFGSDILALVERERLRTRYLQILAHLADAHFNAFEFDRALEYALDVLSHDPCREDAHRMAMRCFVRLGVRSQAFRQYRVCRDALAMEFGAVPEPATDLLYELVRIDPSLA